MQHGACHILQHAAPTPSVSHHIYYGDEAVNKSDMTPLTAPAGMVAFVTTCRIISTKEATEGFASSGLLTVVTLYVVRVATPSPCLGAFIYIRRPNLGGGLRDHGMPRSACSAAPDEYMHMYRLPCITSQ